MQETKWKDSKARDLGDGFKLFYIGECNSSNCVDIMVSGTIKDKIVEVQRRIERIIMIKVILDHETLNIISAYAPQPGLDCKVALDMVNWRRKSDKAARYRLNTSKQTKPHLQKLELELDISNRNTGFWVLRHPIWK